MCRQVSVISEAMEVDALVARMCPGVHIEGPFINPEDGPRGAHDRRHVRQPDLRLFDLLVNAARGKVAMMTLAPELPGADELIQYARRQGVVVAIGHHRADAEAIAEAVRLGASGCTHLGNGSDAMVPRLENYIWAQLGEDGLWASFIADGQHIPAATLRCMIRAKTPERSMLVTDATAATGMPPGRYKLGDIEVEQLASGKVTLPGTPYLAGSSADMPTVIEFAIRGGGVSFEQAIRMASIQPLAVLSTGMIRRTCTPGQPAALVELDYAPQQERIVIRQTVLETWSTSTVGD
jgi:N-acetylglucosamine-6-phosphate deacetylase